MAKPKAQQEVIEAGSNLVEEVKPTAPVEAPKPLATYKSFSVARKAGNWVMITTDVEVNADGKPTVTNVTATEPDLKAIALEKFKIAAFKYWSAL